ncbi:MAG: chalcone isomerase family protein [Desulfosudis oleivorans]|nr:chalcone isomerase family protein [Desulfosudis oleivorans]
MRIPAIALATLLSIAPAAARDVGGVKVPDELRVAGEKQSLVLNGAGYRKKFFVEVYVGALYLTQPVTQVDRVLDATTARVMRAGVRARCRRRPTGRRLARRDGGQPQPLRGAGVAQPARPLRRPDARRAARRCSAARPAAEWCSPGTVQRRPARQHRRCRLSTRVAQGLARRQTGRCRSQARIARRGLAMHWIKQNRGLDGRTARPAGRARDRTHGRRSGPGLLAQGPGQPAACPGRLPRALGGAVLLSQGRHAGLHHRGLQLPRRPAGDARARRADHRRERRRHRESCPFRQEVRAAIPAAGRYQRPCGTLL